MKKPVDIKKMTEVFEECGFDPDINFWEVVKNVDADLNPITKNGKPFVPNQKQQQFLDMVKAKRPRLV